MRGIVSYGAYVPCHRLSRDRIGEALGGNGGRGERAVASYDEDTTSMGVEAARRARAGSAPPGLVAFATTSPAYVDKTNASAIHSALALDSSIMAVDLGASVRGAMGALRLAAEAGDGLAVLSDIRIGRPGSADEREGGDGAAAFAFGEGEHVIAEPLAQESESAEFLDRWRIPGDFASRVWEERFGLECYRPLGAAVLKRALATAGIEKPDHLVVSSPHSRVARYLHRSGPEQSAAGASLADEIGYLGAADAGVKLAETLERAQPGETIVVLHAADGCDALVLLVREAVLEARRGPTVRDQIAARRPTSYADYLTWRGLLEREPPRRPDPVPPEAPPSARSERWKFAFHGSRCERCATVHLPPQRVCTSCGAVDAMRPEPLADRRATIATFTVDHLAYSLAPPVIDVVLDFDEGGRYQCQLTDADSEEVAIGNRVEMTFRRTHTAQGIHNYFWKGKPARSEA
ncbi:MAG: OB-fold domain-containing protein [Thermoleophilaceae bacterium]